MKVYRDWRISGDTEWLRRLWPQVKQSLDYCIETWDPDRKGWLEEPHHNTYDIEFWGPDGMCTSFYLGALQAAVRDGPGAGRRRRRSTRSCSTKGRSRMETELFDGEYFIQKIQWKGLRRQEPARDARAWSAATRPRPSRCSRRKARSTSTAPAACPTACSAPGWRWSAASGQVLDAAKVASHLQAVHRYNLKRDLSAHANPQRPSYACGAEGGLLLCTWPKGGELSLPFVYSATRSGPASSTRSPSHLMLMGQVEEGLEIVRVCRDRYDGRVRNPFNEYECGHWYARAMSSYALLQGLSGARYDAVEKVLYLQPDASTGDFRCFLATATGYGTVGVKDGKPFVEVKSGTIEVRRIETDNSAK